MRLYNTYSDHYYTLDGLRYRDRTFPRTAAHSDRALGQILVSQRARNARHAMVVQGVIGAGVAIQILQIGIDALLACKMAVRAASTQVGEYNGRGQDLYWL